MSENRNTEEKWNGQNPENGKLERETEKSRMADNKMTDNRKKLTKWERYFAAEIGIELKACLYFFCILFYYSMYRLLGGRTEASILHMAEMIFLTYGMGYGQMYLLSNFDEGDHLGGREIACILLCSLIYTGVSFWGRWFDRKTGAGIGFFLYMVCAYVCAFLVYKVKRTVDEKLLNEDLKAFQERKADENSD